MNARLHGKRAFEAVIRLRVILLGEYPGLFRWAQSNHEGTYEREAGGPESERTWDTRSSGQRDATAGGGP